MKKVLVFMVSLLAISSVFAETKIELGCFDGTEVISNEVVTTLCNLGFGKGVNLKEVDDAMSALQVRGVMLFICQNGDQFFLKEEHFPKFEEFYKDGNGERLIVQSETPAQDILDLILSVIPDIQWDEGQGLSASMCFDGFKNLYGDEDPVKKAVEQSEGWLSGRCYIS